jgi:gliding motility-associated-like protein
LKSISTIAKQFKNKLVLVSILLFAFYTSSAQYTKLLDFAGGIQAKGPSGTLITDGIYFYGVTSNGGTADMGTVYRTNQNGTGYVKLHDFTGADGDFPEGSLYYDGTFLYGMTYNGGANNFGVVYKIMPDGSSFQKLLDFTGTNGKGPYGVFVSDGTYLYAMTWEGGANNLGRIFRILPDGTGYQSLLDFDGTTNGSYPASSLYYDGSSLYGMTSAGGANGFGTIFKISPDGTGYDNLYDFNIGTDGREPYGALISDGTYLFGLTYHGGTTTNGTIFRIEPDGSNYSKIHDFAGGLSGGSHPYTTLTLAGKNLYGLTNDGGQTDQGIMFKIKSDGSGFTKLLTFFGASNGRDPSSTLFALGPYLYGTTSAGGASGNGTLFKYEIEEPFTKLLDFTGTINGFEPHGSLYSDGTFLYGMTERGGVNNMGTIFKMKPDGTNYVRLFDFAGASNGSFPKGSLVSDGVFLYGMTSEGGTSNFGTIFKIMPDGTGYTKLHEFSSTPTGVSPESDLYYDGVALYGMTPFGGANSRGIFFKIMPDGTGYLKLSDFGAPFDGSRPKSSLYYDGTFFYGTTNLGGSANMGTAFKIMPDGSNLTKLVDFGVGTNGRYPAGSFTSDGTWLYGTTSEGGTNNYGSLFKIKPNGTGYTTLLDFDNSVYGSGPEGTPLLIDQFLYGLTFVGGPNFEGTIFKIKTDGTNYKKVYEFSSIASGNFPESNSLTTDGTYIFGMATNGGLKEGGTAFRFKDVPGNSTLVDFAGASNGAVPTYNKMICDGTSLYGMTTEGGVNDRGVIFKIDQDGSSFTKLYEFGLSPDGADPFGSLYNDGTFLYGMTLHGGTTNDGTIFKIQPDGSGYQKIFNFNGVTTGTDPWGTLTSDGTYLYGITADGGTANTGTIFKILKDGTGFVKLMDFPINAGNSVGDLLLIGTTLYGTTFNGGTDNDGTVFKIETDGTGFTTLHSFGFPSGIFPYTGSLVYDGTFLYGMTELGGTTDDGTIFKIRPDGTGFTDIHNFQAPTAGIPLGGLERVGSTLYGLTQEGGASDLGTLFTINADGSGYQTLMEFDGIVNGYDVLGTPCHCGNALYGMTAGGGTDDLGTLFKYVLATPEVPTIASFTPTSGPVATTVTITGAHFSTNPASNIVFFGATRATVSAATATQLTVTVPAGATYNPITVSVSGLIAQSDNSFTPTLTSALAVNACTFGPKQDLAVGSFPTSVKITDFNNDGKPDLVTSNANANSVSVLLAGSVAFNGAVDYATGTLPSIVAVADLNGDGAPDLVTSNDDVSNPPNNVSVLLGNGNGTFGTKTDFPVDHSPQFVAIGDVNLDGKNDLVVPNSNVTSVSVLLGAGDGSFQAKTDFPVNLGSTSVVIIDANEDGNPDLAIVNFNDSNIRLMLGDGAGNFASAGTFATGIGPGIIASADVNADNHLDLVTTNYTANTISVLLGNGTSFGAKSDFVVGTNPRHLTVGDVNGDGLLDLAVANESSNNVSILQGTGSGSFLTKVDFITGTTPFAPAIGDINADGKPDLVVSNAGSNTISVFYNTTAPGPTVTSFSPTSGPVGTAVSIVGTNFSANISDNIVYFGATKATIVDATASGLQVLVPVGATYEYISVTRSCLTSYTTRPFVVTFAGTGVVDASTFGTKSDFASGGTAADVAIGDLDGDGKADIVSVNDGNGTVSLFRSTSSVGSVSFAARVDLSAGASTQGLKVADIDGDGKLDIINVSDGTTQVCVHRNISAVGALGFATRVSFATGSTPIYVDFGDLDGDGRTDLAVVNRNSNSVSIFRNTGTKGQIAFAAKQDFAVGAFPSGVAIGDIDGDGKPEVLTANRSAGTVSVFRNTSSNGAVSFAARVDLTSATANSVAVGDMDGDGKLDVVVANYTSRTVSVFRNNSSSGIITAGSFDARADLTNSATANPTYVSIGDVNGDNKPDILVGNDNGTSMQVHRNISSAGSLTSGSFAPKVDYTTGTRPHNVTSGDIDGDGKPEIISSNATSVTISVLRNVIIPIPTLTSFSPDAGPVGTSVILTGTNFSSTPASNTVYFGAVKASVTAATTTQLTVSVPPGATYQPISVMAGGRTAYSDKPFVVTFSNGGAINACSFVAGADLTTGAGAFIVSVGDFDGDGKDDLASTNYSANTISVFRNASSGPGNVTFAAKVDFTTGNSPLSINVADFDADGKPDLVVTNSGLGTAVSVFRNLSTGPGNITFAARVNFTTGDNPNYVAVGDLDKDGKTDIAVVNFTPRTVSVFHNTSTGVGNISFDPKVDFQTGQQPNSIAIADLDGDDNADLAIANLGDESVSVIRNTNSQPGVISFASRIDFATGNTPRLASIADLDGDNKPDLAVANDGSNTVTILRNISSGIGDISYAAQPDVITGSGPRFVSIADLDGDGKVDLAVSNQNDNNVSAYKNISGAGSISFAVKADFAVGARPFAVSVGEFDGDGKADLAATNFNGTSISVLRNAILFPTISGFTPTSETAGETVTITGTNFDAIPANNIVTFNGTPAVVTLSTPTSITTTVPAGATTGQITVTVACNTATSATNFTVIVLSPTINITVNGVTESDGNTVAYSSLLVGNNESQDFVIQNSGTATLSISDIQVTGDFAIAGPLPTSVPAGADETVSIQFTPTVGGTRTGTVTFLSNGNIPSYVINLTGSGIALTRIIEVTESTVPVANGNNVTFSAVNVGSDGLKDLLITNSGNTLLSITDIQTTGDFVLNSVMPASIGPGLNATITLRFTPTVPGARTGTVTISSNGNIATYVINLSGSAIDPTPVIQVSEAAATIANGSNLDFSSAIVGSDVLKDLLITNSGNTSLVITDLQTTGDFTLTSAMPSSIGPGLNTTITLRFTPTVQGARTGSLTILSNGNIPSYAINLSGTGINQMPAIEISASTVPVGNGGSVTFSSVNVGSDVLKDFVITNSGNAALVITSIQTTGDYAFPGTIPSSIGPGLNATIAVRFTPTAAGVRTGTLTILSNGDVPSYVINLSGSGVNPLPVIEVSEAGVSLGNGTTLNFSSVDVGSNALKNLVITNSGNAPLVITSMQTTGDFAFTGTIPAAIGPGLNATLPVRFAPTVAGARTGTLTILSNGNVASYVVNLIGSGTASPVIEIAANGIGRGNGSDLEFTSAEIGSDELKDLVITNSGNATLLITDVQVTGDFALASAVPSSIGAGLSEIIVIRFTPTDLGKRTGTLTILSNGATPDFVINLIGEGGTEIEVYNIVTANPNGQHDFLKIRNITFFPDNRVSIFDRWGNKVFEIDKYDNADRVFKGSTDKGRDLPEGTYYYVIDKNNGSEPFTGFILLRR